MIRTYDQHVRARENSSLPKTEVRAVKKPGAVTFDNFEVNFEPMKFRIFKVTAKVNSPRRN